MGVGYYYPSETREEVVVVANIVAEVDWDTLDIGSHRIGFPNMVAWGKDFGFELLYYSCN